jgi:hypothetical protein
VRNFVTFDSTFEDDMVVAGQGELSAPSGRNIMCWLQDGLASAAFTCTEVDLHDEYGWSFEVVEGAEVIWCMLQYSDPWLLITEPQRGFVDWIRGRRYERLHERVLEGIEAAHRDGPRGFPIRCVRRG